MDSLFSFLVSAVSQLFDVDDIDDIPSDEVLDTVPELSEVPVEPRFVGESAGLPRPWYETIVDDAKADIAKIERGEWTAEDDAEISRKVEGARTSTLQAEAQAHWDGGFQSVMNDEHLRSAREALWQAESHAGSTQLDYQAALQSGDPNRIQSAFAHLQTALCSCESAGRAVQRLSRR